jgi:hypothetical protein
LTDPIHVVVNLRLASIFRSGSHFRAFWIFLAALACAATARGEVGRVPPPRLERDAGPPPLPRSPEHGRRPVELLSEVGLLLPTCHDDFFAERCAALAPAVGALLVALHRPNPFFAFGAGVSYSRSSAAREGGVLEGEFLAVGASGRVYFFEEGAFDPYLELELGYASLKTTLTEGSVVRREDAAFGPGARVAGGLEFFVLPSLRLGGAFGMSQLLLDHGTACAAGRCVTGGTPSGALVGALGLGLRATVMLGNEL